MISGLNIKGKVKVRVKYDPRGAPGLSKSQAFHVFDKEGPTCMEFLSMLTPALIKINKIKSTFFAHCLKVGGLKNFHCKRF